MTVSAASTLFCFTATLAGAGALTCTTSAGTNQTCDAGITMCYRQDYPTGTLTQGCDASAAAIAAAMGQSSDATMCSMVGNPTSCCTAAGTGQKIICSTADFGDQPETSDFASCGTACGTASGAVAVHASGPVLALALWRLLA